MRIRPALPQSAAPEQSAAQPTEVSATSAEEPAAAALALAAVSPVGLLPLAPELASEELEPASEARAQIPERVNQAVASVWLRRVASVLEAFSA